MKQNSLNNAWRTLEKCEWLFLENYKRFFEVSHYFTPTTARKLRDKHSTKLHTSALHHPIWWFSAQHKTSKRQNSHKRHILTTSVRLLHLTAGVASMPAWTGLANTPEPQALAPSLALTLLGPSPASWGTPLPEPPLSTRSTRSLVPG